MLEITFYLNQKIKEYKVGHRARKRDHFPRVVFVWIVWGGEAIDVDPPQINNQQFCQSTPDLHFVDPLGRKGGG